MYSETESTPWFFPPFIWKNSLVVDSKKIQNWEYYGSMDKKKAKEITTLLKKWVLKKLDSLFKHCYTFILLSFVLHQIQMEDNCNVIAVLRLSYM